MNQTQETVKPTLGPWEARAIGGETQVYSVSAPDPIDVASMCLPDGMALCELEANARLITEAGTVHHETGRTPRQLADEKSLLLKSAENMLPYVFAYYKTLPDDGAQQDFLMLNVIEPARAAIANAQGHMTMEQIKDLVMWATSEDEPNPASGEED